MIMDAINNLVEYFGSEARQLRNVNLFRKALYVYILFTVVQQIPLMQQLYGPQSLIVPYTYDSISAESLLNLLSQPGIAPYYYLFFIVQALCCGLGLFHIFPRLCALLVWYCTINLSNRVYLSNTGGDLLVNILLFYLIFISPQQKKNTGQYDPIINTFDNTFILACKLQVVLVYAVSAIYKYTQPEWLNGSALYYILNMNEFTLPLVKQEVVHFPFLSSICTWIVMVYQSLFPILIFIKGAKRNLIICGILVHVGIAVVMGLFNFSLVMICCYLLFRDIDLSSEI